MSLAVFSSRGAPVSAAVPSGGNSYRVQPGDTLSAIAKAHGTTVQALLQANPQIHDPDRIDAGQVLHLPSTDGTPGPPAQPQVHTVRPGDTLAALAARYDSNVATLARLNNIRKPDFIRVGDRLRLPGEEGSRSHPAPAPASGGPPQRGISEADYAAAARRLGVDVAAVKAVAEVEAAGNGFLPSGKPKVLFEAHVFSQRTGGRHDASHPDISSPRWNRALYGAGGEHQWARFSQAYRLDPQAAMQSASWGRFQIMGFNHKAAGYHDVASFVDAMKRSEAAQLDAFASFIQSNPAMHRALQQHDWTAFARAYNGPGYAQNAYDQKIAEAYRRHAH